MPDRLSDSPSVPPPAPPASGDSAGALEAAKKARKKNKVRSAWISFVGRIIAQFIGAAATIGLGLIVLQTYQEKATGVRGGFTPTIARGTSEPGRAVRGPRANGEPVLAVLPLEDYSPDGTETLLAGGMTESVTTALAQIEGIRVLSRTSAARYRGAEKLLPEIGRELGADLIVEGSVTRSGSRVRVTAQLIDVESDEHLWAASYDHPFEDVLAVHAEVADAIARDVAEACQRAASANGTEAHPKAIGQWQPPDPLSRNLAFSTGTNSQE